MTEINVSVKIRQMTSIENLIEVAVVNSELNWKMADVCQFFICLIENCLALGRRLS